MVSKWEYFTSVLEEGLVNIVSNLSIRFLSSFSDDIRLFGVSICFTGMEEIWSSSKSNVDHCDTTVQG